LPMVGIPMYICQWGKIISGQNQAKDHVRIGFPTANSAV
jgi:hypothetical protein